MPDGRTSFEALQRRNFGTGRVAFCFRSRIAPLVAVTPATEKTSDLAILQVITDV
jgi:hypothetical protein